MLSNLTKSSIVVALLLHVAGIVAQSPIDDFLAKQRIISRQSILDNIGPDGAKVPGAGAGLVVASPSKKDPDYFYTWTRDSALTLKTLIDEFIIDPESNDDIHQLIKDYIRAQAVLQTVTNPSGRLLPSGLGLGEAKFHADGTPFTDSWGRPQNDGPALRAIALITYLKWYVGQGVASGEIDVIWPVIANDLAYVGQYWNSTGFDLWEEVSGSSFFTTQVQYRALLEGRDLAISLGFECGPSCEQAEQIGCFLNSAYWSGEYFVSNINTQIVRSGKDANSMLGSNAVFDVQAACDSPTIQPCHPHSLASFKRWVDDWRNEQAFPINAGIPRDKGVALGRYVEDVYFGGNPWYLITLGAAEFLYNAIARWELQSSVTVDETSLEFFSVLLPDLSTGTYSEDTTFRSIISAVKSYAESFISVVQTFTPSTGALDEQYDRYAPFLPKGAKNLTWSHAAVLALSSRRANIQPPSWLPSSPLSLPSSCSASSAYGTYAPAVAAGAPNVTDGLCAVSVRFQVLATTYYGEEVYVRGSATDLGGWDIKGAKHLDAGEYTSERPLWAAVVEVDAREGRVEYSYVRMQNCGQGYIWESTNRTLELPSCEQANSPDILVKDEWQGPVGWPGNCFQRQVPDTGYF